MSEKGGGKSDANLPGKRKSTKFCVHSFLTLDLEREPPPGRRLSACKAREGGEEGSYKKP